MNDLTLDQMAVLGLLLSIVSWVTLELVIFVFGVDVGTWGPIDGPLWRFLLIMVLVTFSTTFTWISMRNSSNTRR